MNYKNKTTKELIDLFNVSLNDETEYLTIFTKIFFCLDALHNDMQKQIDKISESKGHNFNYVPQKPKETVSYNEDYAPGCDGSIKLNKQRNMYNLNGKELTIDELHDFINVLSLLIKSQDQDQNFKLEYDLRRYKEGLEKLKLEESNRKKREESGPSKTEFKLTEVKFTKDEIINKLKEYNYDIRNRNRMEEDGKLSTKCVSDPYYNQDAPMTLETLDECIKEQDPTEESIQIVNNYTHRVDTFYGIVETYNVIHGTEYVCGIGPDYMAWNGDGYQVLLFEINREGTLSMNNQDFARLIVCTLDSNKYLIDNYNNRSKLLSDMIAEYRK